MSPASAAYWRSWVDGLGALICGRTLFDFTGGWGGQHTMGVPVVVVTHEIPTDWVEAHPGAPFHFVTDGVEAAVGKAQEIAGEATVAVTAGTIAGQCLGLGLLDAVAIDLVPVVMGGGRRYCGALSTGDVGLGDPIQCVQGERVTHLFVPGGAFVGDHGRGTAMRTLHVGLQVADQERSIEFYTALGYEVLGQVPATELGTLTMLKLPGDEFVALELVHDPEHGSIEPAGVSHLVVQVEDLHATVAQLASRGVQAETPGSPDGSEDFWTTWVTDPDGYRIELVQWPAGHPDGMTRADLPGGGADPTTGSEGRSPREVVEELFERQRAGDPSVLDELVATDLVNHAAGPQGREGLRRILATIEADLGPTSLEQHHLVAEEDLVVQHVTLHGTHRGSSMPLLSGSPATGKPAAWAFIHIWRVADGMLVEHWACRDDLGLLERLRSQ